MAAGLALAEMLGGSAPLTSSVRCAPKEPFNLLAAMALWAGLRIDPAELHAAQACVDAGQAGQEAGGQLNTVERSCPGRRPSRSPSLPELTRRPTVPSNAAHALPVAPARLIQTG